MYSNTFVYSLQNHQLCSLVENIVSERIADIGSAGGGSLEGLNKGKCTNQEMLLDVINGPNHQEGEKKLKGSVSGKAPVRKMWPGRCKKSGGHKKSGGDKGPEKEKGPNRENIHVGILKRHCRNTCTDIDKTKDRDKKQSIYERPNRDKKPVRYRKPEIDKSSICDKILIFKAPGRENGRDTCKRADNDERGGKDEKRGKDKGSDRDGEQSRVKGPYRDTDPGMDKEPARGDGIGGDKEIPDRDKEKIPDRDKGPEKVHNNGWIRMINILIWVIMSYCGVLSAVQVCVVMMHVVRD